MAYILEVTLRYKAEGPLGVCKERLAMANRPGQGRVESISSAKYQLECITREPEIRCTSEGDGH